MNPARVAALLRELADELESEVPAESPTPVKRKPRRTRETRAPMGPVDDLARKRAERLLRERGIVR